MSRLPVLANSAHGEIAEGAERIRLWVAVRVGLYAEAKRKLNETNAHMSPDSKHEVTQLTPTIRLALYMATYSMAQLLGVLLLFFTVPVLIGGVTLTTNHLLMLLTLLNREENCGVEKRNSYNSLFRTPNAI